MLADEHLARIGIAVSVKQADDPLEVPAADIALGRTGAPYPDPVAFLARLVEQAHPMPAPALIQLPARAATIRGEPRHAFARALDARLARDSHIAAFGTWAVPDFSSEARGMSPVPAGLLRSRPGGALLATSLRSVPVSRSVACHARFTDVLTIP